MTNFGMATSEQLIALLSDLLAKAEARLVEPPQESTKKRSDDVDGGVS